MKERLKLIFSSFLESLFVFLGRFDKSGTFIMTSACRGLERHSNYYFNFLLRPKNHDIQNKITIPRAYPNGELAVVLQGVIETKDNFTLETVHFYKQIFPGAIIIISTWDFTPNDILEPFKALGCEIVINKSFKPSGYHNVNFQLKTSLEGAKRAKELGAKYVLKNRTDLRIYEPFSYEYLKGLLKSMPITNNKTPLKERIITLEGYSGQMFFPQWIQDYIFFGQADDLILLFDQPIDNRPNIYIKRTSLKTGRDLCESNPPEIYITNSFFSKYFSLNNNVKEYWEIIGDYFIVINLADLNVLWRSKYEFYSSFDSQPKSKYSDYTPYLAIRKNIFYGIHNGSIPYSKDFEILRDKYILNE